MGEGVQTSIVTVSGYPKLKQGLARLVEVYHNDGSQPAYSYATENGIVIEDGKIYVHIFTEGDSSEVYVDVFRELNIGQINTSSQNNIVQAFVSVEQLVKLSEQRFVIYIVPATRIRLEP